MPALYTGVFEVSAKPYQDGHRILGDAAVVTHRDGIVETICEPPRELEAEDITDAALK